MRVLITGATGFLGKYIIDEFVQNGWEIIAFGRNSEIGKNLKNCTFVQGDFTKYEEISNAIEGTDAVVHAGGLCAVWGKWQNFYNANVLGTKNVLDACIKHNVPKFIFVSSCSVYSSTRDKLNVTEDEFDSKNHLNYYIKTKIMAENLIKDICAGQNAPSYSIIRPHGIFGVGDTSIMPRVIRANDSIGIPLFRKGKNLIDIVCAENVAYSLRLCAETKKSGTYNITNGEIFEYKALMDKVFNAMGITPKYIRISFRLLYSFISLIEAIYKLLRLPNEPIVTKYTLTTIGVSNTLNINRAKDELGYEPKIPLQKGIESYAEWWKKNQ